MKGRAWLAVGAGILVSLAPGCRSPGRAGQQGTHGSTPEYVAIAAAYNQRVAPLDRLWCTTTETFWFPNEEGEQERAQVEGHLQYLSPSRFSLTFEKVGELQAALGCNERSYWWIELGQQKRARIGEQSRASPTRIAKLGLPVHPLDLVETLGITPLPPPGGDEEVRWSDDGKSLVVTVAGRLGRRRFWLEPGSFEPSRIDLLDAHGEAAVSAVLTRYESVTMPPGAPAVPRMATRIEAGAQNNGKPLRVRLTLYDPLVSSAKPKAAAFDLDVLRKAYGIKDVELLDEPSPANPAGG